MPDFYIDLKSRFFYPKQENEKNTSYFYNI